MTDGETPLDADEAQGLLVKSISTRGELNNFEQVNILRGLVWANSYFKSYEDLLSEKSIKLLHKKMFEDVWSWAGTFRRSDKNIGVHWSQIRQDLRNLIEDTKVQIESKSYEFDEIAVRFHHRLVSIHPFPNGNGRHARECASLLVAHLGKKKFPWGEVGFSEESGAREVYLRAIRLADQSDYDLLIKFARMDQVALEEYLEDEETDSPRP